MESEFWTWMHYLHIDTTRELVWVSVGFFGQILFASRWIVQWISTEMAGETSVPDVFWYLSFFGSLIVFVYATYRVDQVIMVAQACGTFVYARNIVLLDSNNASDSAAA